MKRKLWKKRAKQVLKKHYLILVATCVLAGFIGTEFSNSLLFMAKNEETAVVSENEENGVNTSTIATRITASDVLNDLIYGNSELGEQKAAKLKKEMEQEDGNEVLGHRRGVLAGVVNAVTSGSVFITILSAIKSISRSENVAVIIFIAASLLLMLFVWFAIQNTMIAVTRRIFLESRIYEKVSPVRFTFFFRVRKWMQVAWDMFVLFVYQNLWNLTIIGGVIKSYSYKMVPYIIAENPSLKANEAITLSRQMMVGHKWECLKLDLTFLGWRALGVLTGGMVDVFFTNPYVVATYTEYYTHLRQLAIEQCLHKAEALNDRYLYEKAEQEVLHAVYFDIYELMQKKEGAVEAPKGILGFLANTFGIVLFYTKGGRAYEEGQLREVKISSYQDIMNEQRYPTRLYPIQEKEKRKRGETIHYLRRYSIWSLIILFFGFSLLGWIWEVSLHLVSDGVFVNRGVLHGPWLPIYGTGSILILAVLNRLRKYPVFEFLSAVLLCGVVEYFTSYYLEMENGKKWWDYSGYFLNLNGRICAEGLLVFGLGGLAIVYVLAPMLDNAIRRIHKGVLIPLCLVLVVLFSIDQVYSKKHPNTGKGITDYQSRYAGETNRSYIDERVGAI